MEQETIVVKKDEAYIKQYKLYRVRGSSRIHLTTMLPDVVTEREARIRGMTVEEFSKKFMAEWSYNAFKGLHLEFVPMKEIPNLKGEGGK